MRSSRTLLAILGVAVIIVTFGYRSGAAANQDRNRRRPLRTDLRKCKIVKRGPAADDVTRRCVGVRGYSLLLHESDDRMSVDVVSPTGKVYPLEYWHVVSDQFSSVGKQAEWRTSSDSGVVLPVALVIPLDVDLATENRDNNTESYKKVRYWVVARIGVNEACVTDKLGDGTDVSIRVERAVAAAATRPCLPGREADQQRPSPSPR